MHQHDKRRESQTLRSESTEPSAGDRSEPKATAIQGHSLPPDLQADMERGFSHSFDTVRIWPEPGPWDSPESIGADAYAVGRDIVFDEGAYQPESELGVGLLAHELAHVVQQSATPVSPDSALFSGQPNPAAEAEANAAAFTVSAGGSANIGVSTPPAVAPGLFDVVKGLAGGVGSAAGGLLGGVGGGLAGAGGALGGALGLPPIGGGSAMPPALGGLAGGLAGVGTGVGGVMGDLMNGDLGGSKGGLTGLGGLMGGLPGFGGGLGGFLPPLPMVGPVVDDDNLPTPSSDGAMLEMNRQQQRYNQMFSMMSSIMGRANDASKGIIQNIR